MASNNNIFCVSNPAKTLDGLWQVMQKSGVALTDTVIFVPSRRAVRTLEKMIVEKNGHAVLLPQIVPLGEGFDGEEDMENENVPNVVSDTERVITMAYLLSKVPNIRTIPTALPIAHTLISMQNYLENVGKSFKDFDFSKWKEDKKIADHFKEKAALLEILVDFEDKYFNGAKTQTKFRNDSISKWGDYVSALDPKKSLVVVCGSTASVPVTRNLMKIIAGLPFGRIILSGKIEGNTEDFMLDTNPYHSEYEFLTELGLTPNDVQQIDVGPSNIDFMNVAFGNTLNSNFENKLSNCHLVESESESEEVACVGEIARQAIADKKTVLVITPDAAANTRLKYEFERLGIEADFSSGMPGNMSLAARAILNLFDEWIENKETKFSDVYTKNKCDLFDTVADIVEQYHDVFQPKFNPADFVQFWVAVKELSRCITKLEITDLNVVDARAYLQDCFASISIRDRKNDKADVVVIGNIESRMQTADVVILTGLNEGMFPSLGYTTPWLSRKMAEEIGLPSPNHKVSLMALDFMNLSCGPCVYWVRSKLFGGVASQESRFLSRVIVLDGDLDDEGHIIYNDIDLTLGKSILKAVRKRDGVERKPLNYDAPTPPSDWSEVFVTDIDKLIHNPYLYYVEHILRLNKKNDYWQGLTGADFGSIVHKALENSDEKDTVEEVVKKMDDLAIKKGAKENTFLFKFWHNRFVKIAPYGLDMIQNTPGAKNEKIGEVNIKVGEKGVRIVRAKADRVWDGGVLDIKTGYDCPSEEQLANGTKPQLPLEALMLQTGGFDDVIETTEKSKTPEIRFLKLTRNDMEIQNYTPEETQVFIEAAQNKTQELFNMYVAGNKPYEYRRYCDNTYKRCKEFARADEHDD